MPLERTLPPAGMSLCVPSRNTLRVENGSNTRSASTRTLSGLSRRLDDMNDPDPLRPVLCICGQRLNMHDMATDLFVRPALWCRDVGREAMSEKYTPADGEPVPMSQFTLGPRYSSEDMYRDYPDLGPGSRVAFEKNGVVYTDTVQSVTYQSGLPAIWPELSWWQQMVRRFTPSQWRKPLQPIRPATSDTVTVSTGPVDDDVVARAQKNIGAIGTVVDGLLSSSPSVPSVEG